MNNYKEIKDINLGASILCNGILRIKIKKKKITNNNKLSSPKAKRKATYLSCLHLEIVLSSETTS